MRSERLRVAVIGGGISGLAAAFWLSRGRGIEPVLFEAAPRAGGVIATERRQGCLLEQAADSFLTDQPAAMELIRELGLVPDLIPTNRAHQRSFVLRRQRLVQIPEGFTLMAPARWWPFVRSPAVSLAGKWRALLEPFVPPRTDPESDESIAAFVERRFGRDVYTGLAEPVVRGVASGDPSTLSMQAVLPQFLEMERRYGSVLRGLWARRRTAHAAASGARYSLFMTFRGGMQALVDRLAERLPSGCLAVGSAAERVAYDAPMRSWRIMFHDGRDVRADAVCLAVPPFRAAGLLQDADPELAGELRQIRSASWVTVYLAYRAVECARRVRGFGFVVPSSEPVPAIGCTFTDLKFPGRAPLDLALFRVFLKPEDGPGPSDRHAEAAACATLERVLGLRTPPVFTAVHRAPQALPHYAVGHPQRIARIMARVHRLPGLALTGNAYAGHGVAKCIAGARHASEQLEASLAANRVPSPCWI